MSRKNRSFSRRDFLKAAGVVGFGSTVIPPNPLTLAQGSPATKMPEEMSVPRRPFGKTGTNVSILSLGGVLKETDLLVFRQALKLGVSYWDTADSYGWGQNEKAIGNYFAKFPGDREKVFLVTKAGSSDPKELSAKLNESLQRMNASHIDMFLIHYVSDVKAELTEEVKAWAEKAKAGGKIRFFGFSTHKNMERSMLAAAGLGWIDGIMMSYNYRLMAKDEMKRAVDACVKAGIGLTAMKTQAAFTANFYAAIGAETDAALKMTESFLKKGYTAEQAKLKVVWENPHIASICSAMPNMTILQANVDAALNKHQLSENDKRRLEQYAQKTAPGFCAGCAHICESAIDLDIPVCDLLRCSMYRHGYGDRDAAQSLFHAIATDIRDDILKADYSIAEKSCPQKIEIGRILRQSVAELA